jgi:ABC-type proline/glycine betaine transport system substrate-binding protein
MISFFRLLFYFVLALSTALAYSGTCFNETKVVYYINTEIPAELPTVKTLIGGWQSATASMYITKILLEEMMGVKVELWPTESDNYGDWYDLWDKSYPSTQYQWLDNGDIDYIIECWELTRNKTEVVQWFSNQTIKEIGNLGTLGEMYIFVPDYTIRKHNGLGWYESLHDQDVIDIFLNDTLSIFDKHKGKNQFFATFKNWAEGDPGRFEKQYATNETEQIRPFIFGAFPTYQMSKDIWDRMHMLGLSDTWDFWMVGSEQALTELLEEMTNGEKNFIVHLYAPTKDLGMYKWQKLNFPFPQETNCYDDKTCEQKLDVLFKTINNKVAVDFPEIEKFLATVRLSNIHVNHIIADANKFANSTTQDSVCTWLKDNYDVWKDWIFDIERELPIRLNLDNEVMIIMWVAAGFLTVVTSGALHYLMQNKDMKLVRAVSPQFLLLAGLSGIIVAFAGVLWTFDDFEYGLIMCNLRWVFSCTGNTLLFASLSLKTWRVWDIFRREGRGPVHTNCHLYSYLVLILIPVAAMLVWKAIETVDKGLKYKKAENSVEYQYECPDTTAGVWLTAIQIVLACVALILCLKARDIPDDFNEIVHIMYLCIFTMLLIGFGLVVFKSAGDTPRIRAIIMCLSHLCVAVVIEISVLGRTIYLVVSGKAERKNDLTNGSNLELTAIGSSTSK